MLYPLLLDPLSTYEKFLFVHGSTGALYILYSWRPKKYFDGLRNILGVFSYLLS